MIKKAGGHVTTRVTIPTIASTDNAMPAKCAVVMSARRVAADER
jgi:hypothetical protein